MQINFRALIVINKLYTFNDFIMIIFNQLFCSNAAYIIQFGIAYAAYVLGHVLPQTLN